MSVWTAAESWFADVVTQKHVAEEALVKEKAWQARSRRQKAAQEFRGSLAEVMLIGLRMALEGAPGKGES